MSKITSIRYSSSTERKKPQAGDRRFLKGRQVWQVREPLRVPEGMPYAGAYIISNGRQLYKWVDEV